MSFTVAYRCGGQANCEWRAALPVATREEAQAQAREIERGGRKALIFKTRDLENKGLPEGWEA